MVLLLLITLQELKLDSRVKDLTSKIKLIKRSHIHSYVLSAAISWITNNPRNHFDLKEMSPNV